MSDSLENLKIAVALRTARTALGWSQQEFADRMGVAKSTVARIETVEMSPKADFLTKALRVFQQVGLTIDLLRLNSLTIDIGESSLLEAQERLSNDAMRRSDRAKGILSLLPDNEFKEAIIKQSTSTKD